MAKLYETYGSSVRACCQAILRDTGAAEDATQETFLRVQRHIGVAEQVDNVGSWIHRIAMNYCLNQLRNRRLQTSRLSAVPVQHCSRDEDHLLVRDEARYLMRTLPAPLRSLVQLRYLDGLDQSDIAGQLGISRRTVVARLAELRHRLERAMAQA
ncbi:MAG TPA: sigma-70 family RNA polymerase sigma factor [Polyangiaceae bacterium]|nr:sigma-70 family RNA polymerase sigma factor [Polyangiaceae bacterium]